MRRMSMSNATHLTLKEVVPAISGKYSCEVSADAPSFQTALYTGQMDVVTAPKNRPLLQGLRARYRVGETLRANCTSADSSPAANLSWLLNGHQVDRRYVTVYYVVRENGDDLETASSILEKVLVPQDFNSNSRLKIKCTASILSVYWQTTEKSVELERPRGHFNDYQSRPTVLLNLKTDVESVSIAKDDEPTKVTSPVRSGGSSALFQLPSPMLCWRLMLFQLSFALT
ncbi:hypothetical protein J6590_007812 [Homalodisca vitripennis]|nr:hypothetical protein J6590_007812 [Homalodisca vitripennis]